MERGNIALGSRLYPKHPVYKDTDTMFIFNYYQTELISLSFKIKQ